LAQRKEAVRRTPYDGQVAYLKEWLQKRLAWVDVQLNELK
jgi:hypothetical protein